MNDVITKLGELFREFPGIGPRQARRFVYFLLAKDKHYVKTLQDSITELRQDTKQCASCYRYFIGKICDLCKNSKDSTQLLIVEKDVDLENVRKTGTYYGLYFVLGGLLPVLEKEPERRIRFKELKEILKNNSNIKEIIIALSANTLGDNTIDYLRKELKLIVKENCKISILGRGLSTGTELEYSDGNTLSHALANRK